MVFKMPSEEHTDHTPQDSTAEYIYTNGLSGPSDTRHEAVGEAVVRARENGRSVERATESVQAIVKPVEPLRDCEWLTDAHDTKVGMEVLIDTNAGVERHRINDVAPVPKEGEVDECEELGDVFEVDHTLLIQFSPDEGVYEKITAEEINSSPNMVVV